MLNIKRENLPKSKIKLTISVPPVLMVEFFDKAYNKLSPSVEVKGFRAGKAPRNLTISAIGESRLNEEIINSALQETYVACLKQEKIIPIAPPKISIKKMVDLTSNTAELEYDAEIDLMPEVEIGDYKKLKVESKKLKEGATKEEIDQVLSHLRRQHATFKDVERPAKKDDRVEIDFEGFERGVKLENFCSKNYPIILGSKTLIPEFEEKIIGFKKGDEKEFEVEVKAPGEKIGDEKAAKKKIKFKVKVLTVQEVELPELDDQLAKKFQKNTISELKKAIEEDIIKQKEIAAREKQENQLIEELLKISKIEIPESLVIQETGHMIEKMKKQVAAMGIPFEKYLEQIKKTEEDLQKDLYPQAEKTVKVGLILGEIGKKEKMDLKDKDSAKKIIEKLLSYTNK